MVGKTDEQTDPVEISVRPGLPQGNRNTACVHGVEVPFEDIYAERQFAFGRESYGLLIRSMTGERLVGNVKPSQIASEISHILWQNSFSSECVFECSFRNSHLPTGHLFDVTIYVDPTSTLNHVTRYGYSYWLNDCLHVAESIENGNVAVQTSSSDESIVRFFVKLEPSTFSDFSSRSDEE